MTVSLPVLPALRWTPGGGYSLDAPRVEASLRDGATGFILFGGSAQAAREASEALSARAGRPLLLGADLERGAGQQFQGATPLPPLGALGALGDLQVLHDAGALTGREALAVGVPWVFAPVADLALEPDNPIVGTRALGREPGAVGAQVAAWIDGCLSVGALPCAKHFPGHGRTRTDSHATLPVVEAPREELLATDVAPFREAIRAGVPSLMTAHVAYPALDPSARPATRSGPVVEGLLREAMGFHGVVVTDALIMEGAGDGETAVVEALAAGVDLLLYPPEELSVAHVLQRAREGGALEPRALGRSRERVARLMARLPTVPGEPRWGTREDRDRSLGWALRTLTFRGPAPAPPMRVRLTVVDDDLGGPYPPPSRETFPATLRAHGVEMGGDGAGDGLEILAVHAEPRAWKGRAGLSEVSCGRVEGWVRERAGAAALVVAFGGPRLLEEIPQGVSVLLAWGGEPLMQEAAARHLAGAPPPEGAP